MHNTTGDVATDEHWTRNKILKTKLYMHNTIGDVILTNIRRETNTKNKVVHAQHFRRCYTDEH